MKAEPGPVLRIVSMLLGVSVPMPYRLKAGLQTLMADSEP